MGLIHASLQLLNPSNPEIHGLMDLVLQPQLQRISVNPDNPNLPLSVAKGISSAAQPSGCPSRSPAGRSSSPGCS